LRRELENPSYNVLTALKSPMNRSNIAKGRMMQNIIGLGIVIVARVSSAIHSLLKTSFCTQLIGGSVLDEASYKLASISILGSFMIAASTAMNTERVCSFSRKVQPSTYC